MLLGSGKIVELVGCMPCTWSTEFDSPNMSHGSPYRKWSRSVSEAYWVLLPHQNFIFYFFWIIGTMVYHVLCISQSSSIPFFSVHFPPSLSHWLPHYFSVPLSRCKLLMKTTSWFLLSLGILYLLIPLPCYFISHIISLKFQASKVNVF